jgi:hypothetical protein
MKVASEYPVKTGKLIRTTSDNEAILAIGMDVEGEALLFIASDEEAEGSVVFEYDSTHTKTRVRLSGGEARLLRIPDISTANELTPVSIVQK